jgi:tripartite-type tricarboxylate transporter receptor subunit TctC
MKLKNLITLITALAVSASTLAFDLKEKPIEVVVPFSPGGGVDQTFRHMQKYADSHGITLVGIYKPGAEGLIGMNEIAGQPKDGYHIAIGTAGTVAIHRMKNSGKELVLVSSIRNGLTAFVSSKNSIVKNLNDLDQAIHDGAKISFGYGAPGQKMVLYQLFEFAHPVSEPLMVPYKGGAPVVMDLVSGHIDIAAVPLSIVKNYIDAGKVNFLALGSQKKLDEFPNVPLITKKYPLWQDFDGFCVILPAGTDAAIIDAWGKFIKQYLEDPVVQKEFIRDFTEITPVGSKYTESTVKASIKLLTKMEN